MKQEIKNLIQKHYKNTVVDDIVVEGEEVKDYEKCVIIKCHTRGQNLPKIALRILNKYRDVRLVHFIGEWVEAVYTRETLKWFGYKVIEL